MTTHEEKLRKALVALGARHVLHPENQVKKKRPQDQAEIHRVDVARTFKREFARLAIIEEMTS